MSFFRLLIILDIVVGYLQQYLLVEADSVII